MFLSTLIIGLDIGLGIGVLFSLFVVVLRTILPYSPSLGETRAWHYPPDEKLEDDDFDEEDLRVLFLRLASFTSPPSFSLLCDNQHAALGENRVLPRQR